MPRLIILGFDAADPRLVDRWVTEGHLPNIARLKRDGAYARLRSTIQPLTPLAWTSMVTGMDPGGHGVYDWHERDPQTYHAAIVGSYSVKAPTLWQRANRAGLSSGVMNVPLTYPPRPLNGWLISDLLTPPGAKCITYPDTLRAEIDAASGGYKIFFGVTYQEGDEQAFLDALHDTLERRRKALLHLLKTHPADFVMAVFMESDHVMHSFWKYYDAAHPSHKPEYQKFENAIRDVYKHLDDILGDVLALIDKDTTLMLVSDHGSGPYLGRVYVNKLLMRHGLLAVRRDPLTSIKLALARARVVERAYGLLRRIGIDLRPLVGKRLRQIAAQSGIGAGDIDWARTQAYVSGDFGQIALNLQGREKFGMVDPRDKEPLIDEIIRLLDTLTDDQGKKLVDQVWRGSTLYHGSQVSRAPDIVFSMRDFQWLTAPGLGAQIDGLIDQARFGKTEVSGAHALYGIVVAIGPGIRAGATLDEIDIKQIAPTALYALGLAVPKQMDGRVIEGFYEPAYLKQHPILESNDDDQPIIPDRDEGYSPEELKQVEDRLKGLGYIE